MSSQPCSSRDILDINRSKEYTLIATTILESVLTDTRLNAQSVKLWQLLFNQARYNPNLDIKISYSYLSKKLGKSTRTIARYVETLQNAGYLIVTHNFDNNGGQRPSTISVRVPQFSIEHAKDKKDRHHKNHSSNNELLIENLSKDIDYIENVDHNNHSDPVAVTELVNSLTIEDVLHGTNQDNIPILEVNQIPHETISTNENTSIRPQHQDSVNTPQDKNDRGGHDINVIQNNINKKDINKNNNNIVVPFSEIETKDSKLSVLQDKIHQMEKRLSEGTKELSNIKDHTLLYDQIRKNSELEGSLHLARIALERLQKEFEDKNSELQVTNQLTSDPSFMVAKTGDRAIPQFTFKRLVKSLKGYGYQGNSLNCLINEIVFEARFGSLINCNKSKTALSVDNAVNIALKLVRENRWSTPVLLKTGRTNNE